MNTINSVVSDNMCCSCGICAGACPKQAIDVILEQGIPTPQINTEYCVECGICHEVCPGIAGIDESASCQETSLREQIIGTVLESCNAYTTDESILKYATSGGVVTTLISSLLQTRYDAAFVVNTNQYDKVVHTVCYKDIKNLEKTGKSRYVSILQDEAIRYMLKHRSDKLIFVGTSCAIRGIDAVIRRFSLPREQYLLIGLFCDKTMSYNVWDYFVQLGKNDEELVGINFRDKDANGWPGGVKLEFKTGQKLLDKKWRSDVKDFFCHPRCLYCSDKLNKYADISVGDNYTGENTNKKGSSSIIIRTERGKKVFNYISHELNIFTVNIDQIYRSQECSKKWENIIFSKMQFGQYEHPAIKTRIKYYYKSWKIKMGARNAHKPQLMKWLIALDKKLKF